MCYSQRIVRSSRIIFVANVCVLAMAVLYADGSQAKPAPREKLDYNRDVRPILAAKCFACHGNDPKSIRAGLKLDDRKSAISKLESGNHAIVPGSPAQSKMVQRITSKDVNEKMPPADSNRVLLPDEIAVLTRWIAEGAEYKPHWAFVAPVRPALPSVKNVAWPKNEIDRFVLAKLESKRLKPNPEADKATLIRRVSLDLAGLPPTPSEVNRFLADRAPNAYEKVVDRLLASPRFGERMAMDWVDYARYADSNGYQADFERYQWRWRDYVINAFNSNMPYDRFTIEQLAGDLLPNPTTDQLIATGFNRNHRINTEGGVIAEEWRVETVIDRVETTSTVWLGLTSGCARCHDHKYDPISQKEFYSLYSYFNNVPETGSGEERPINHPPVARAPMPGQDETLARLSTQMAVIQAQLKTNARANISKAVAWRIDDSAAVSGLRRGVIARYAFSGKATVAEGQADMPKVQGAVKFESGRGGGAVRTTDNGFLDLGAVGDFESDKPFSYGGWVNPQNGNGSPIARMDEGHGFRGWDLSIQNGRPAVHLIETWPTNALKVIGKPMIANGKWTHVAVTYDGSSRTEGIRIYINGKLVPQDVEAGKLKGTIRTQVSTKIGRRTDGSRFEGMVDDLALFDRVLSDAEVGALAGAHPAAALLAISPDKRTPAQQEELARLWSFENDPQYKSASDRVSALAAQKAKLESEIPTVMVMREMPKPRVARVLVRGQYDKYGDEVKAGLPAALPPLPAGVPNNRLGFAKWIVSPSNPLTARVTVNRFWERFFGMGIVQTSEDFGTRAEYPSHPELLDWLATEFVRSGWNIKATMKKIAMSATYRQSSRVSEFLAKNDPQNRWLARGPRFRLPAEVIRDQALSVGGMLVEKLGGPSTRPYQPEGIWNETQHYGNLLNYVHDKGDGLHRRSLYTIWKRTAAPPNMTLFDVPTREYCRVRRARTDTPLQALALMNDVTYVEAARALAQRMLTEAGPAPEQRLNFAYETVLARRPSSAEAKVLLAGLRARTDHYRSHPADAQKLVAIGDFPRPKGLNDADLAAYIVTASTLLNLDETVTKE